MSKSYGVCNKTGGGIYRKKLRGAVFNEAKNKHLEGTWIKNRGLGEQQLLCKQQLLNSLKHKKMSSKLVIF